MKAGAWIGLVVVLAVVVGGLMYFRSTTPNGEENAVLTPVASFTPAGSGALASPSATPLAREATPVAAPSTSAPGGRVMLAIEDTGFSPQTVTVKSGTTVTFVNNGQGLHWPASDVHPTHNLLPGFDSLRGLGTGEEYSFTFTKTGRWSCHDHLHPALTCTITVE